MATVYLAHDIKHDRQVAIKVLKPELAAVLGADRFVVEIKTTAALQHPHILPLFDSGTADSFLFYVMPYIQGETVRDKLNRETQLGIDDAVRIAREVADALQYAHEHGIVHRDIKPENILLHGGHAMVADFGIALAVSAAAGGRMTETGLSLGTPHYMSPEQATAEKEITPRSDIYSLGSVLYEMLSGEPPHMGNSAQQIIMKIIAEDVAPVTKLRKAVPDNVAAAVAKSLEKLPADRFASAKEFGDALGNAGFLGADSMSVAARAGGHTWQRRFYAALAACALLVVALAIIARKSSSGSTTDATPLHLRLSLAPGDRLTVPQTDKLRNADRPSRTAIVFSPDGQSLVYAGERDGKLQLFLQPLAGEVATPIPGTDGAESPFFSFDGKSLGFWADGKLRRVSLAGGPATDIAKAPRITGASWGENDRIIVGVPGTGLIVFPVTGAAPPDTLAEAGALLPQFLPGGQSVVFTKGAGAEMSDWRIEVMSLQDRKRQVLMQDAADARYVSTGHLVFARRGTLMAMSFDLNRLEAKGSPVVVLDDVMQSLNGNNSVVLTGAAQVAFSTTGQLAYLTGGSTPDRTGQLLVLDRHGSETRLDAAGVHQFLGVRLSPNGKQLAATINGSKPAVEVLDLERQTSQVFTTPVNPEWPVWSPDGQHVVHSGKVNDSSSVVWTVFDNSRPSESVVKGKALAEALAGYAAFFSIDGKELFTVGSGGRALYATLLADGTTRSIANLPTSTAWLTLSPDGKWVAYGTGNTNGVGAGAELFVQPWPALDRKWKVSAQDGTSPAWTKQGRELIYLSYGATDSAGITPRHVMAVDVGPGPAFAPGPPHELFTSTFTTTTPIRSFDISPDGSHFYVSRAAPVHAPAGEIHVVVNWFAELKKLMAGQGKNQ